MKPQYSSCPSSPYSRILMIPSCCSKASTNCMKRHHYAKKEALSKGNLFMETRVPYLQRFLGRLNPGSWQKECWFSSDLSRSALSKESFSSTACNEGFQLNQRGTKSPLLHQYGRSHPLVQTKFSNRDPDPPGDPPRSSTLSNNSQIRIVPFTNRLVDVPIGKEAERETKITRRYQICH